MDVSGEGFHQAVGEGVDVLLEGNDIISDDKFSVFSPTTHVAGGEFGVSALVKRKTLDEDLDEDEIYATVHAASLGHFKSNTIRPPAPASTSL